MKEQGAIVKIATRRTVAKTLREIIFRIFDLIKEDADLRIEILKQKIDGPSYLILTEIFSFGSE